MPDEVEAGLGSHVGGTLIALLLAPLCFVVVGGVAGVLYGLLQYVFSDNSQWWTMTLVGIVQAFCGTFAARSACDAVLRSYSKRAIFAEFVGLVGALVLASLILLPFSGKQVAVLIQFAVLAFMSWKLFWKGESLDDF